MADVLGIKVRLQLDAMESDKDIRNQLEKIQLPPVKVNLEIGKILNKEELDKLDFSNIEEKFKDIFKIDERVIADIKATGEVLERVVNAKISSKTLANFKEMAHVLGDIGKSFELDNNVISRFDKLNDILKEFNGLSDNAQKALLKPIDSNIGLTESLKRETQEAKYVAMSAKNEIEDILSNMEWSMLDGDYKRKFNSLTRYLDSSETGLKTVMKKQLDAFSVLTEQTFGDGTKVRNIAVDVESNLKKLEKAYETTVKGLTKSKVSLHKALDIGDIAKSTGLEMFVKEFEDTKKKMMQEAMNTPFAEELMEKFFAIDMKHFRIQDMEIGSYDKGVQDKDIKKQVNDYIKEVKTATKNLNDLEKEFKKAKVNGLDEYANDLEIKINEAKGKISGLLNVKPHDIFPDDKSSRVELKQRAKAIAEAMEEANRVMNLKFEDNQNNKALSKFVNNYKTNLREMESLEKDISTALNNGEYDYASNLQTRLTALQQEQAELKESAQALAKYEQAMKNVAEMEEKSKNNIDLHNSYLENKNKLEQEKADAKLVAQQQKEADRQRSQELKDMRKSQQQYWEDMLRYEDSVAKGYETVATTLNKKQNAYTEALVNENTSQIEALEKTIDFWSQKKKELMEQINGSSFTSDFYDRINDIDKKNDLFTGEFESKIADSVNKKSEKDNKAKEDALLKTYEKLSKKLTEKENSLLKAVMEDDIDQVREFEESVKRYENDIKGLLNRIDFDSFSRKFKEEFARIDLDNGRTQSEFVAKLDDSIRKKLIKDNENLQKSLLKEYESISSAINTKEGDLLKALSKDSMTSADAFEKTLDKLYSKQEEVISKIKASGLEDVLKAQLKEIGDINSLKLNEVSGAVTDKILSDAMKKENAEVKKLISEYTKNASALSNVKKQLLSVEDDDTAKESMNNRVNWLENRQNEIKNQLEGYEKLSENLKTILSIDENMKQLDKINSDKYLDSVSKKDSKEQEKTLERISKEREKLSKAIEKEQKAIISTYEEYAKLQQQAEKQYLTAIVNDDIDRANALDKAVDHYAGLKSKILSQIQSQGLDQLFKNELESIDKKLNLDLDIHTGGISDKLNKNQAKEDTKALKEYLDTYEDLYKRITEEKIKASKLGVQDRNIEAQAHIENRKRLEEELKLHKQKEQALKHSAKAMEEVKNIEKHYDNNFELGMANVSQNIQVKSYREFIKEQNEMVARYKKLVELKQQFEKDLSTAKSPELYKKLKKEIEEVGDELTKLDSKIVNDSHRETISIFNGDKTISQSKDIAKSIDKIRNEAQDLLAVVRELGASEYVDKSSLSALEKALTSISTVGLEGTVDDVRDLNIQLSESKNLLESIQNNKADNIFQSNKQIKLDDLGIQINKFKDDFKNILDKSSVEALEESFRRLSKVMDKESFSQGAKELTSQLKHARSEMEGLKASTRGYNFFEDLYDNMRTFQLADVIVDGVQDALYSVKDIVVDIDSAMANVRKVALPIDVDSIDKLDDIKRRAIDISKEVGMASADVINSISDTIQNGGYAMEEAIEIARQTMMLANVGEMTQESATKGVVTMLSGFKLDPLKEVSVVVDGVTKSTNELTNAMDKINYVGNNFSISTEGILNAFQGGATVLQEYGVGMTETVALITGANKTLQDPSVVKKF